MNFDKALESRIKAKNGLEEKIEKQKSKQASFEEGSRGYDVCEQIIKNLSSSLAQMSDEIEYLRPEIEGDMAERENVKSHFKKEVDSVIPNGFPIVFHGTSNIGTVKKIIESGGLLTPEQRGVSMTSFASAIDVTYKNDIRVTCEFADKSGSSLVPYGAIFAFKPQESEVENVVSTKGSEVYGGVDGVSFRDEPERLFGIITTSENLERVSKWCEDNGLDKGKVFSHQSFLTNIRQVSNAQSGTKVEKLTKEEIARGREEAGLTEQNSMGVTSYEKSSSNEKTNESDYEHLL